MERRYRSLLLTQLADQARDAATKIHDRDLQLQVLLVAARYMVLAKRAEKAEARQEGDAAE